MKNLTTPFKSAEEAESAFYAAFRHCDIHMMRTVWSNGDIICIHPGSHAIIGCEAVMRSWETIFNSAELPEIRIKLLHTLTTEDISVHVLEENIGDKDSTASSTLVLATNIYRRHTSGWLLFEHHASITHVRRTGTPLQ